MFERKAIFEYPKTDEVDIVELELELIDFGLEEIEIVDDMVIVSADYESFGSLSKALEEQGVELSKSLLQRFATSPVHFTEEQMLDIEKMLNKLDEDDDVQEVFTNIA